ncbi:SDR family oxidoreductase [Psychrosphaera sp. B3R10]|uniref:SDR family oxidoreductase n=1 Tax=unclassified Psychrosphaera TaxID=2641570 RepID=UPI001C09FE1B|nr:MULTISPECIES: SDR family oxidoreductase [unclassified Psychrosphaera]MBU2882803.1 SDR family oxidoreductase [Psychrosphaera sp. I2R16]MBU2988047.1 SDR family oxidoreductase [Psychrosphaera sp. B3R10]
MHILITGASSGIGKALSILLSKDGHTLSLCGRSKQKLASTLTQLELPAANHASFCISDFEAVNDFCVNSIEHSGAIDVLINCAGLNSARGAGHELPINELDWMMKINCYAPIQFMQSVLPDMIARQQGFVINVMSTTCLFSNPGIAGYSASKAAFDSYTKIMRKELRENNIKVSSIYPGGVDTDFRETSRPQYLSPYDVAVAIKHVIDMPENVQPHELVIRPQCEENF